MKKEEKKDVVNNVNDDFSLTNTPIEAEVVEEKVTKKDFEFIDNKSIKHERSFETKPTTFFKDSLKRFRKNKSSVVAACILGILTLMAIFVPVIDQSDVKKSHVEYRYLEPKLFNAGTGFWDGCKTYKDVPCDSNGWPSEDSFPKRAIRGTPTITGTSTSDLPSKFSTGGYVHTYVDTASQVEIAGKTTIEPAVGYLMTPMMGYEGDTVFDTSFDNDVEFTFGYTDVQYSKPLDFVINFRYTVNPAAISEADYLANSEIVPLAVCEYSKGEVGKVNLKISDILKTKVPGQTKFYNARIQILYSNKDLQYKGHVLMSSAILSTTNPNNSYKLAFESPSFDNPSLMVLRDVKEDVDSFWICLGTKSVKNVVAQTCSFIFDTYENAFGLIESTTPVGKLTMDQYIEKGWCEYDYLIGPESFKILNPLCPIDKVNSQIKREYVIAGKTIISYDLYVSKYLYKDYGFTSMPKFLFGTDKSGKDMFKYVFEGLRTSLLLGVCTFIVCFTFGLIWGSVSGYFGGSVDLAMERFTDILSGVPWIVVMTLCIIHLGSSFATFALALCLTGWIGTASLTRTQFYRFRDREYVLASRTLGARSPRLIFKHVLPNAMGTIITSSVMMIPGVIFSEATIAYLGLGLTNISSLGVILSDNQAELFSNPYLLVFPSVVIALIMISFNLFGNGLRDAINPSLKGEGE